MLKEDILIQKFNEDTTGNNYTSGLRVFNNDLVSSLDIIDEEEKLIIDGNVISENLFNEYKIKLEMDIKSKSIISTSCTCADFEKNEPKRKNYCCKHLVAAFYKSLPELSMNPKLSEKDSKSVPEKEESMDILSMLLEDEKEKDEIKLEVYINKDKWNENLTAEFRIGLSSMSSNSLYILKDINHFLLCLDNGFPIEYSKYFAFDVKKQRLSYKDRRLIEFIEGLKERNSKGYQEHSEESIIEGKYIKLHKDFTRQFFEMIKDHRIYLNEGFFHRSVDSEVLFQAPMVDFDLKLIKDEYVLKSMDGMPLTLSENNDVFLYGTGIYLPDYDYCYRIRPYLKVFNKAKVITFDMKREEEILKELLPKLNILTSRVTISKNIKDKIVMSKASFCFYFDKKNKDVQLELKVRYGSYEFNIFEDYKEKIVYRESKREAEVIQILKNLGFEEMKGKFYLLKEDDYVFNFFKVEIEKLQSIGEVYYSENFKGIKGLGTKGIVGNIKSGKYDYFEINFKIGDIDSKENANILRAFRDNLKYYKLKSGEYLDLEQLELNKLLKLLDTVTPEELKEEGFTVSKSKAAYLDNYIEENNIRYLKGIDEVKRITDKFKNISRLEFMEPGDLKGVLRDYQKIGYNWFKTLDYLELGGILGDEMGLGKTLQAIAFISSNKGSKSLIVTPTSLVYNWVAEFEKFSPNIKVAAVNGSREERESAVSSLDKFDVIITTYNLLKRDLEIYRLVDFDYCLLDEAQYIKNPNSQNALGVKEIKAKRRFALTGTPIENSLMELWSIFDFIMPGYLYDEKRFSVRFHKKLRENPVVLEELNRLIKPFILRRRKKEVIKELPEKIEKNIVVNLEEEQKKVYKLYTDYALDLIKKRVKDDEFKSSKIEILSYITKLRQLCLDPSVVMEDYKGESSKIEALIELLNKCIGEGHRILVFSQFTSVLKNIQMRMKAEGITYSYLDGSIASEKRMELVKAFNKGESSVFLISLKAGGTGLNLTSADIVIHFDPWWNPAVEEQATDRAHRIGQKKVVEVIKLVARGTIEEKIVKLQQDKKKLISELMGDELSGVDNFFRLSEEELLELFS